MNYNLNGLEPTNFEHLVQSLAKKILGDGVSIFGAGADGQREASFNGEADYPGRGERWSGYWVIQAKFKSPDTKTADLTWLKKCFRDEMTSFAAKKEKGKTVPDNYLFFTNVVLTPVEGGIKDKMNELAAEYSELIPHIHILGADDIKRLLDCYRDVAVCYSSFIMSGDILSLLYDTVSEQNRRHSDAFFRYLLQAFNDDYCSKMEQAGQLTDERVSIDKVYIDLDFKYEDTEEEAAFVETAINTGNGIYRFSAMQSDKGESLRELPSNKYVLKGSAGQGKSTVCQFLAQIYRAAFVKNFSKVEYPKINEFIERINSDGIPRPACFRVPFRIELRLYSSWMLAREREGKSFDLVSYISSVISEKSAGEFDNDTLRLYLQKYSWVFFFDGLDEVPESSNRKDIMREINSFIEIELRQNDTDAMFFATTRPEGYAGEFQRNEFRHLDLLYLDKSSCFLYLTKLLRAIEPDSTRRAGYMEILNQGLNNRQIAFMMQTPLQATIIAILVRAGGEPPRDKYSLFDEYFNIILKREKQKGVGSILNENQDLVEGVYYLLGYELQNRSTTADASDALITLDRMKELIKQKLDSDGISESSPEYSRLLEDCYNIVVLRINFASEIKEGFIGFSIRSMQEFLAAVYIVKTSADNKLSDIVKKLAKSSYWKNTFIFLVECIAKIKTYYLDHLIDTILGELNGNALPVGELDESAELSYGSQVAVTLLSNNIFKNKPKYEHKLCKYIARYCELHIEMNPMHFKPMSDSVKGELTDYLLNSEAPTDAQIDLALILAREYSYGLRLTAFLNKNAAKAVSRLSSRNYLPVHSAYDFIGIALDKGQILKLNTTQIGAIIKSGSLKDTDSVKATLFRSVIRSTALQQHYGTNEELSIVSKYFDCNFSIISDIFDYIDEMTELTDYFSIGPFFCNASEEELAKMADTAERYSLGGLALILRALCSRKIEPYIDFYRNIGNYRREVSVLYEHNIIRENNILFMLWKKLNGEINFDFETEMLEDIQSFLDDIKYPESLAEALKQCERKLLLPKMLLNMGANYNDFKSRVSEIYSEWEIKKYPALCDLLVFVYSGEYQNFHGENSSRKRDALAELALERNLPSVLEYAACCGRKTVWIKNLTGFAFLKMNTRELREYAAPLFESYANLDFRKTHFSFKFENIKTILDKMISYILSEDDRRVFPILYDFIVTKCNLNIISECRFGDLSEYGESKIALLTEIGRSGSREEVMERILPLLSDDDICRFMYEIMEATPLPDCFMPAYLYLLKKYRAEGNTRVVSVLEQKICELISSAKASL